MKLYTRLSIVALLGAQLLLASIPQASGAAPRGWEETKNRIDLDSVCAEHTYGSIDSRNCRSAASRQFKQQCKSFTSRYNGASSKNRKRYKAGKEKYCYAARHFRIVD